MSLIIIILLSGLILLALVGWKSISTGWQITIKSRASGGWVYRIMDIDHNLIYNIPLEHEARDMESISPNGRYGVFSDDDSVVLVDLRENIELSTIHGTVRSWSPDNRYFSYVDTDVNSLTYLKIFIVEINENGDLSEPTPMTLDNSDSLLGDAMWSPDSEQLAYLSYNGESTDLLIADADGSDARRLLPRGLLLHNIGWSLDGKQIAFYWYDPVGRTFHIGSVSVDGTEQEIISVDVEALISSARWSPDGRFIAYASAPLLNLYIIDVETADITGPIEYQLGLEGMRWSPDSERLVFRSARDSQLYVIGRDGRNIHRLTNTDNLNVLMP